MTLAMPPVEEEAVRAIRADPIVQDRMGNRVWAELPEAKTLPMAHVHLVSQYPVVQYPRVTYRSRLQIDVWGEFKGDAFDCFEAITAALEAHNGQSMGKLFVSHIEWRLDQYMPDPGWLSKPRYISDVELWVRLHRDYATME